MMSGQELGRTWQVDYELCRRRGASGLLYGNLLKKRGPLAYLSSRALIGWRRVLPG
jgi:hypothetical protein